MKILIVEDNAPLAAHLSSILRKQHYTVDLASDGQEALNLLEALTYELLVLDVMLPKLDGISLCRQLRERGSKIPILLLTARNTSTDKIIGLDAGADDYLVKPFEWQELLARIRALGRRSSFPLQATLEWGDLRLEPNSCQVMYGKQPLYLTPTEYGLLELFLRHPYRVFNCRSLLNYLWSFKESPDEATIRSHIKGLRRKLNAAGAPTDLIETVYGLGYRLQVQNQDKQTQLISALTQSWERRLKPDVLSWVVLLEQMVATILQIGNCQEESRQQAIIATHNLAGLLGSIGFAKGSELAAEMEELLQNNITIGTTQATRLGELVEALRRVLQQPPLIKSQARVGLPAYQQELPRLLIVDDNVELAELLRSEAINWGMEAEVAINTSIARTKILYEPPDVVLLDLCFPSDHEDGLKLLAELTSLHLPIPVIVLTVRGALTERLKVAQLKAQAFLQKPIAPKQAIAAVSRVLQLPISNQVLIVDDDPQTSVMLRVFLESWGLKLMTLADPRQFWHTLETVVPELLILNLEIPYVDGIELCRVVRNDPRWDNLPIIAIAPQIDPDTVRQIFAVGADDFVSKPIVESELVKRIVTCLKRV